MRAIARLVAGYQADRILLGKDTVTYYEDVQEFWVAEALPASEVAHVAAAESFPGGSSTGEIIGCGALHVMWEDLAEVRTLAVQPSWRGRGVGHAILQQLCQQARDIGVLRVFCLTFEVEFFEQHGFKPMESVAVDPEVYAELLRSADEGVAEFLDLARVKQNTLGNTRMLLEL